MCHEVRTPLNGCLASAEMLLETPLKVRYTDACCASCTYRLLVHTGILYIQAVHTGFLVASCTNRLYIQASWLPANSSLVGQLVSWLHGSGGRRGACALSWLSLSTRCTADVPAGHPVDRLSHNRGHA